MSGSKILRLQVFTVFGIVIASIWVATEWTAWQLAFQPELCPPSPSAQTRIQQIMPGWNGQRLRDYIFRWYLGGSPTKTQCGPAVEALDKRLNFLIKSGAGEGIRTLDPNLGKVVLYP